MRRCIKCRGVISWKKGSEGSKQDLECPHCGEKFTVYTVERKEPGSYKKNKRPIS